MSSPTPFAVAATLQLPGDSGLPPDPLPFNASSSFVALSNEVLNLVGAGSQSVSFGSIASPGAKGLFIKVDPSGTAQPVQVKVNGSATGLLEISPGGELLYVNPVPVTGITSIDIIFPTSCVVRVWVLG